MLKIVLSAIAAGAAVAQAQVVFENLWDADATDAGAFSQPNFMLAGEFDLRADADIEAASWRGTMFSRDPLDTGDTWAFELIFWADNAGMPGGIPVRYTVDTMVTDTGLNIDGERVYQFDASFPTLRLSSATTYFFSAINAEAQTDTFRWNVGTDAGYSGWYSSDNGDDWDRLNTRTPLNFRLIVPAPASLTLLGLGGLAIFRRR